MNTLKRVLQTKNLIMFSYILFSSLFIAPVCYAQSNTPAQQLTNEILKRAYTKAYGERIMAYYSVEAKGYFDGRKLINFAQPIKTISVTVPPWLGIKIDLRKSIINALDSVSVAGTRIDEYKVEISPGSDVYKITVYPMGTGSV